VATYEEPARHPTGIEHVVVNGQIVIDAGTETDARPGRLLRRSA
jgi:N-acyl-D-aspartate/D-glutamate deacylase